MHIHTFQMPTTKLVWQLIQLGNYVFSIDLKDAYLHIPIVKHHWCIFFNFVLQKERYQWNVWPFGMAKATRASLHLLSQCCFFPGTNVSVLLFF